MNQARFSAGQVFVWANFLAMSWTWCIGMYLPVLLLRDFGNWAFIIFAIPNVLGAAAMGWIFTAESSRLWITKNQSACVWFSRITVAFHAFFAAWIIRQIANPSVGFIAIIVVGLLWILASFQGGSLMAAIAVLAVSLTTAIWGLRHGNIPFMAHPITPGQTPWDFQPGNMLGLACTCFFGFILCPFLDLTFHAARRALSEIEARAAFSLGFGGIFFFVILFTVAYSGLFVGETQANLPRMFRWLLTAYLLVQCCLKVVLHAQQLRAVGKPAIPEMIVCIIPGIMLGSIHPDPGFSEKLYRTFMAFYGLVFPAYVWLVALKPRQTGYHVLIAILIALPLFYLAFIQNLLIWAIPAVAIVLIMKFITRRPIASAALPAAEIQK